MRPARLSRCVLVPLTSLSLLAMGSGSVPASASLLPVALPDSAGLTTPLLAQGRMLDAAGRPTTGVARLYAWPAWSPTEPPGTITELPLVAWSVAAAGGGFVLRAPLDWAARTDNFVLFATHGDLRYERHLVSAGEPLEIRFDPQSESVDRSRDETVRPAGFIDKCQRKQLDKHGRQLTRVGELGTTQGVNATFSYVTGADSTVSVAVRTGDRWGVRGERHVANEQTSRYNQDVRFPEQHGIDSFFTYVRWEVNCNPEDFNPSEELSAEYWEGGGRLVAKHVPSCVGNRFTVDQPADSKFVRERNKAQKWSGAAHVLGAEFSASSGYSTNVNTTWTFSREQPSYKLCGSDDIPTLAHRVFVGLDKAPRSCPAHGPCPS